MKKLLPWLFSLCLLIVMGFEDVYYDPYEPIFMLRAELEKNVKLGSSRELKEPGKIYIKDNFIFIP